MNPPKTYISVVPPGGCSEIMFGIATYNPNKGIKVADNAWDVYDVVYDESIEDYRPTYIDLSKLSVTKDNYVAIKSESHTPIFIKIGASVTSQQVKYDASTNKISFDIKKSLNSATVENTVFEYRISNSGWEEIPCYTRNWDDEGVTVTYNKNAQVFQEYQPQGASLYVRAMAQFPEYNKLNEIIGSVQDANDNTKTYTLYNGGYMHGKESKLTINKKANGPSVSADYVKSELSIPAKTEYRVLATDGAFSATIKNDSKISKTVSELLKLTRQGEEDYIAMSGTLEVRKQANGDKTPSSKWTRIDIAIQEKIAVNTGFDAKKVIT